MAEERRFKLRDLCFIWQVDNLCSIIECVNYIESLPIRISLEECIQFSLTFTESNICFNLKENSSAKIFVSDIDVDVRDRNGKCLMFSKKKLDNNKEWVLEPAPEIKSSSFKVTYRLNLRVHLFLSESLVPVAVDSIYDELHLLKLSRDMVKLQESSKFADYDKELHKAILFARAPKLLKSIWSVTNKKPGFKSVISYLYSASLPSGNSPSWNEIVSAADALEVDSLKEKLRSFPSEIKMLTNTVESRNTFNWSITSFSSFNQQCPKLTEFSLLLCPSFEEEFRIETCLEQFDIGEPNDPKEVINVSVKWHYKNQKNKYFVRSKTSIVDVFGELQHTNYCQALDCDWNSDSSEWNVVFSIDRNKIMQDSDILLPKNSLSLLFDFFICKVEVKTTENVYSGEAFTEIAVGLQDKIKLSSDLLKLYNIEFCSDITLKSKSRRFRVHKAIIWARASKILEAEEKDIKEIDDETLDNLLKYLYSATLPKLSCAIAMKLYLLAYKFEIPLLKQKCLIFVKDNLKF